ncbi:MAG: hypothetical protein FD123_2631 [Bacteroidetes bacterium]|nr:MAG: hypothetical protein FD123_2631 [Bacteroidota bacterium]
MKTVFSSLTAFAVLLMTSCAPSSGDVRNDTADSSTLKKDTVAKNANGYDSLLAKAYGADEYGMHRYVMAFLRSGPSREKDSVKMAELQKAHLANIGRMADEGKLVVAGPFMDDGELRGIYIFNVATVEEAKALTETDPLIQSGGLVMELHPWYGSAAMMGINNMHKKVSKKSVF